MKKILLLLAAALALCSCKPEHQGVSVKADEKNGSYYVKLLFEVDGVKVYRFYDCVNEVYFTNRAGESYYQYNTTSGTAKTRTTRTHRVQCLNN